MIIGNRDEFAIETIISEITSCPGFLALAQYCFWVKGFRYGIPETDATWMGYCYDHIQERLNRKGQHVAFMGDDGVEEIINSFREAGYSDECDSKQYYGMNWDDYFEYFWDHGLVMAPDGDSAFSDSSYILQFDRGESVRIIGFQCQNRIYPDPESVRDLTMPAERFYSILEEWSREFMKEVEDLREKEGLES